MSHSPRIVSLLPGLTDTVLALGMGQSLVGISHECDLPDGWLDLPRLTRCLIPEEASSCEIDQAVRDLSGIDLYELDIEALNELKPDLILTQSQCDVCAISETSVVKSASLLKSRPVVYAANPTNMSSVFLMIREVARLLGLRPAGEAIIRCFEDFEQSLDHRRQGTPLTQVAHLEWLDPVMGSGHWNPEIIRMVGGRERTSMPGAKSRVLAQKAIQDCIANCDLILLGLCGFSVERSLNELNHLPKTNYLRSLLAMDKRRIFIIDGHRHMVRPGPILLSTMSMLAEIVGGNGRVDLPMALGDLKLEFHAKDFSEILYVSDRWIVRP